MKKFYYYYFNISEDSPKKFPIENPEIDIHVHEDDMHLESEQKRQHCMMFKHFN